MALSHEANEILGASSVPQTADAANALSYATAVAHETMRLRPVFPVLFLEAEADTDLGGVFIEKGTPVWLLTRPGAMRHDAFEDARRFRPERWLASGRPSPQASQCHIPFGSGPRLCVGRALAMLEMRVVLATLFRRFDVERVGPRAEVTEHFSYSMHAKGLRVRLHAHAHAHAIESPR